MTNTDISDRDPDFISGLCHSESQGEVPQRTLKVDALFRSSVRSISKLLAITTSPRPPLHQSCSQVGPGVYRDGIPSHP
jgi:hypothetical protein